MVCRCWTTWLSGGMVQVMEVLDRAELLVPQVGSLRATGQVAVPCELVDPTGQVVAAVAEYFADLQACDRSPVTVRSYGMDLLRWFRFLWAVEVGWDRASRAEARDFMRWMSLSGIPSRPHWRSPGVDAPSMPVASYSVATRAHCETVLRNFYSFHVDVGAGPLLNPFPLDRARRGQRSGAHQSPMELAGNVELACTDVRLLGGYPRACLMRSSTGSSPGCLRTETVPWWRSTSRPGRGRPSCWVSPWGTSTLVGA